MKIKFPTAHTILLIISALVAILTWVIPSGKYKTLSYDKDGNTFQEIGVKKTNILSASQGTLDSLGIKIPLDKFTSGKIYKPVSIPNTYEALPANPQGFMDLLKAPIRGIQDSADVIFFVLIIGGLIGIMNLTGAFDAGIAWLAKALKGREYWLIILVTSLVALGGTTFGLAEETMAFFPILIPIFLAAKYDAMVGLACIFLGSAIGTMCSTVNPFSVIIASDAAGINWTTGLYLRIFMLILVLIISLIYIFRYAQRVKKDATKSIIYDQKEMIEAHFLSSTDKETPVLTNRLRLILLLFTISFVVMIYGVSKLDWWFVEMTTTFFVASILIGIVAGIKEGKFITAFCEGASDLLSVALIIGIARGISILMNDGLISDSVLYYASDLTTGMSKGIFVNVLLFVYSGLSFFISSSSGMAVLTMPIMSPLADTVGIGREHIVDIYMYGLGLFYLINPTGLILAALEVVKISFDKWLKFVLPLFFILIVTTMVVITTSVYL